MMRIRKQQSSTDVAASGSGEGLSIPPPGADCRCYYCNASVKCGQQCCIWREAASDTTDAPSRFI